MQLQATHVCKKKLLLLVIVVHGLSNALPLLFKVVDELLNRKKKTELPDCDSDIDLADKFSEYFVDKISKIRKNLNLNFSHSPEITSKHVEKDTSASMIYFTPATISEIRKFIGKSASKSCSSDPVPT